MPLAPSCLFLISTPGANSFEVKNLAEMKYNASCDHRALDGKQTFPQKSFKTATSTQGEIGGLK